MTGKVWIALILITIMVVFAMWFGGWFAQFRLLRTERLGWRIRLGTQLACVFGLQRIGHRLIAKGIRQQTPQLSEMERNILVRKAKTETLAEMNQSEGGSHA